MIKPAENFRTQIDKRRLRNALFYILCLLTLVTLWWISPQRVPKSFLFLFLTFKGMEWLVVKRDLCPTCRRNIQALPNEKGILSLPRLSRAIRMCPYCGADFSVPIATPDKS